MRRPPATASFGPTTPLRRQQSAHPFCPVCVPPAAVAASSLPRDSEPCDGCRSGSLLFGKPPGGGCHAAPGAEAGAQAQAQTEAEAELHPGSRILRSTGAGLARAVEVAETRIEPAPWAEAEERALEKDAAAEDAAAGDAAAAEVPKTRRRTASGDTLHSLSESNALPRRGSRE